MSSCRRHSGRSARGSDPLRGQRRRRRARRCRQSAARRCGLRARGTAAGRAQSKGAPPFRPPPRRFLRATVVSPIAVGEPAGAPPASQATTGQDVDVRRRGGSIDSGRSATYVPPLPEGSVMKIANSLKTLKKRDKNCRVVRRQGRVYVINKGNPRLQARQ